jgi:hypothetical protein
MQLNENASFSVQYRVPFVGRDNSVGIANGYESDGMGIESR